MSNPEDKVLGRPKGSKNKRSHFAIDRVDHYKAIHDDFLSPLDFLLCTMNGIDSDGRLFEEEQIDLRIKIECAKTAVKYTNPQLTSVELELRDEDPDDMTDEEKQAKILELLKNPAIASLIGANKIDK